MTPGLAQSAIRGGLLTTGGQALTLILRLAGLVVLARLIEPSVFGLAAIVNTVALFATNIIQFGLVMATVQHRGLTQRAKTSLFLLNAVMGIVMAGALFFLAGPVAELYGHDGLEVMFQWLALVPLLSGLQGQFRAQLITDLRYVPLTVADVLAQLSSFVAALSFALNGLPVHAVVSQTVGQATMMLAVIVLTARWWPTLVGDWRQHVLPVLRVGSHVFGMNLAKNLGRSALLPIMGLSVTPAALGAFDRAQQFAIMPVTRIVDQLQRVAVPVLTQLREEPQRLVAYFAQAQAVIAYGAGWAFGVLAGTSAAVVAVVFGKGWEQAGVVLGVLAVGSALRAVANSVQWLFIATARSARGALWAAVFQPAIVLMSLLGLPWGIMGVAIGNTVAWALYWPIISVLAVRAASLPARPILATPARAMVLFSFLPGLAAYGTTAIVDLHPAGEIATGVGAAVLVTATTLFIPAVRTDVVKIMRLLRGATGRSSQNAARAEQ